MIAIKLEGEQKNRDKAAIDFFIFYSRATKKSHYYWKLRIFFISLCFIGTGIGKKIRGSKN